MTAVDKIINDYKDALSKLERNDKLRINVLTILAQDYAKYSSQIVGLIENAIFEANNTPAKLTRLYVIDSIVKNVRSVGNYSDHFSVNLVKVFLDVFQRADEEFRKSLFKLRNTWQEVFPRGKLYALDVEVHNIDPKWPVATPQLNGNPSQKQPAKGNSPPPDVKPVVNKNRPPVTQKNNGPPQQKPAKRLTPPPANVKNDPKSRVPTAASQNNGVSSQQKQPAQRFTPLPNTGNFESKPRLPAAGPQQRPAKRFTPPPANVNFDPRIPFPAVSTQNTGIVPQQPPIASIARLPFPGVPMQIPVPQQPVRRFTPPPANANFEPMPQFQTEPPVRMNRKRPADTIPNDFKNKISVNTPTFTMPSNNRIFVDGKAYEVFYLENAAVIERNGVPHRISFCGPPRDVIIDGVPHRMAFGETKAVMIDNQTHYLRFGAPSRELYMGDFPFKGVFGGPPIAATINGKRHEIRLCGPPPEVKIEQDPCYELARHMQNIRQNNAPEMPAAKKEDSGAINVAELLNKLKNTGVFENITAAIKSSDKAGSSIPAISSSSIHRESTPPIIPSNIKMDKFDVREKALTPLIATSTLSATFTKKQKACTDCGIFFEDVESLTYRNHLDQHIQSDLNAMAKSHPMGDSRQRYMNADDWVSFSKVEAVNKPPVIVFEHDSSSNSDEEVGDEETME
ncbi:hypothetical protein M3Y97_00341000 [Aphelenchoides bicaudatus]|nr:hypothetical protein M3Y97_00341000 [Aphelenchoides bicaudatus]